jgi:hypothetical protein
MSNAFAVKENSDIEILIKKVWAIDLEPIIFKLVHPEDEKGWTIEKADVLIEQYRQFLVLTQLYPEESVVPSKEIDKVWHTHILDTAKYRDDCQTAFGKFIDHFPYFGLRGELDAKNLQKSYDKTRDLFRQNFNVDPRLPVGVAADCGSGSCSPSCDAGQCGGCDNQINLDKSARPVLIR